MVTIVLRGGLGNQMFQYAAGLQLAAKKKTKLLLDTTLLNDRFPRSQITYYTFNLGIFNLEPSFTVLSRISHNFPVPGLWAGMDILKIEIHRLFGGHNILFGFYQNEAYFKDSEDLVRGAFTFKHLLDGEGAEIAKGIQGTNSISLHVRRGDYVSFKNNEKIFGRTDAAYYKRAIAYVAGRVSSPHFFVFSNDIEWCKKNVTTQLPVTYLSPSSAGPNDSSHFRLMSLCKHHIIANSTFSWWAAWLDCNPEKIVVAPKQWAHGVSARDILPAGWVSL
jgi:hypothetical protein